MIVDIAPARFALLLVAPLGLAACVVGPDYQRPEVSLPANYVNISEAVPIRGLDWWRGMQDPELVRLIDESLKGNLDIAAADARVEQARAQARVSRAVLYPQASVTGSATRQRISESGANAGGGAPGGALENPSTLLDVGSDASWETDFAGGNKRAYRASLADAEASLADYVATRLRISAEVARAYSDYRLAEAQLRLNGTSIRSQQETLDLVVIKEEFGEVSGLDVRQAEARLATLRAETPGFETARDVARNQIALLLGKAPNDVDIADGQIPTVPDVVALGLPQDLLRNRPDVIAAERRLDAAVQRIGAEQAEYYPKVSLAGSVGLQSDDIGELVSDDALRWNIGPSLQWRVLDFGQIDAAIERAEGVRQEAWVNYRAAILAALNEVETEFARYEGFQLEALRRTESVVAERAVLQIVKDQYLEGSVEFLQVLDAERNLATAELAEVRAMASRLQAYTALMKALGGFDADLTQESSDV